MPSQRGFTPAKSQARDDQSEVRSGKLLPRKSEHPASPPRTMAVVYALVFSLRRHAASLTILLTTSGLRESRKRIPVIRGLNETWHQSCYWVFHCWRIVRRRLQSVRQRCLAGCARWGRIQGGRLVVEMGRSGRPAGHRRKIALYFWAHVEGGKLGNSQ